MIDELMKKVKIRENGRFTMTILNYLMNFQMVQ